MQSMKEWALYYAEKDLAVFPLNERNKSPATKNGFKDATTDHTKICAWWDSNPNYNIGIATGAVSGGVVVIDLDIGKGKNGCEVLKSWQKINGKFPDTWCSITGRGGYHLFFKTTDFVKNSVNLYDGIDIRGNGGYIVAPPSIHPNGNIYKWKHSLDDITIADADVVVMKFMNPVVERQTEFFHASEVIEEGERNTTLFKLASSLQAKGLDEDTILTAVAMENEKKCNPPLSDDEVKQAVMSALKYTPGTSSYTKEKNTFPAIVKCLADITPIKTEWLWYPYIPMGKITLIQGDPGMGKTMMVLKIAATISKGGEFFTDDDLFIPPRDKTPGNVVYQTAEDGIADTIVPRLKKMNPDFTHIYTIDESNAPLSMTDERLEEIMKQYNPKLLILDPLQAYLGANVDMHRANEVRPVLKHIGNLAEKYNCAVLIVMHMSKMTQATALHRGLGSIDIPAAARSVLVVGCNPADPEEKVLAHLKSSLAKHGESITFKFDKDEGIVFTGHTELQADDILNVARVKKERQSVKKEAAEDFLLDVLGDKGYEALDVIKVKAAEIGVTDRTLYNAKKDLGLKNHSVGFSKEKRTWWLLPDVSETSLPNDNQVC